MNVGLISYTALNATAHNYLVDDTDSPSMRVAERWAEDHDLQAALQSLNVVIDTAVLYTATHTVNGASCLCSLHYQSLT